MVIDFELTLNRFGWGRIGPNKIQLGCLRVARWSIAGKHAVSFEVNWRWDDRGDPRENAESESVS
jgi:hypothetical protein